MRKFILWTLFTLCCSSAFAGEVQGRLQVQKHIHDLLAQGNYAELDRIYQHDNTDKVRTSNGEYALDVEFYAGLSFNQKNAKPNSKTWSQDEKAFKKWMIQSPTSAAPQIAYAELLDHHALSYLGKGDLRHATEEYWHLYHDYVNHAQQYLTSTQALADTDPHWYVVALKVADDEEMNWADNATLFFKATNKYPAYDHIYMVGIPRLMQSSEAKGVLDNLVHTGVVMNSSPWDRLPGEIMYARIYSAIEAQPKYQGTSFFYETLADWYRMKIGLDAILSQYPDDWNTAHYAYLSCTALDQAKTAELFKRVKGYSKENWPSFKFYKACASFASQRLSPALQEKWNTYEDAAKANLDKLRSSPAYILETHESDAMHNTYNEYLQALMTNQ
ncbi:hypothetical protein [Aquirhabdus parva]|uniref:DUF4034 domain-containing protein n=1 Tax=Aquirhabdus parva TaxID=2283318 RepID=A0A345P9H6_9GAMM|nr:hypothetical protein [Aquirhabdus parva]AXI03935.1 hypothetical protein HYN46_14465 [Aquirhabdus parva]